MEIKPWRRAKFVNFHLSLNISTSTYRYNPHDYDVIVPSTHIKYRSRWKRKSKACSIISKIECGLNSQSSGYPNAVLKLVASWLNGTDVASIQRGRWRSMVQWPDIYEYTCHSGCITLHLYIHLCCIYMHKYLWLFFINVLEEDVNGWDCKKGRKDDMKAIYTMI